VLIGNGFDHHLLWTMVIHHPNKGYVYSKSSSIKVTFVTRTQSTSKHTVPLRCCSARGQKKCVIRNGTICILYGSFHIEAFIECVLFRVKVKANYHHFVGLFSTEMGKIDIERNSRTWPFNRI
jgi:hypothetical protein